MIIFIKKLKTREGINAFDTNKVKKEVPAGYKVSAGEPIITLTANHIILAYKCEEIAEAKVKAKPKQKEKSKGKKIVVAKV